MRYIDPTSEPVPAAINYSTIAAPLDELLNTLARKASGSVYRGETRAANVITKTVVQALKRKYKNKCGYCENIEYEPCVEHHRPIVCYRRAAR
jgi:hypothetical protein